MAPIGIRCTAADDAYAAVAALAAGANATPPTMTSFSQIDAAMAVVT
jgi:hypothetical protein